jgi:hypothetical protein
MSVYVLALNSERRVFFRWKCISAAEARAVLMRVNKAFSHCLSKIAISGKPVDDLFFHPDDYDRTMNFTYCTHPRYYAGRGV